MSDPSVPICRTAAWVTVAPEPKARIVAPNNKLRIVSMTLAFPGDLLFLSIWGGKSLEKGPRAGELFGVLNGYKQK